MAYDDKDDTKFPTRFGQATGHANERTMLDELGGANGIRHRQRMGADGVTTHVKTRGGHPHFWNEPLPKDDEEPVSPIYMDSGAIDLLSVNPANPLSYLASPLYYSNDQRAAFAAEKLLGKITPPEITNLDPPVDTEPGESFTPVTGGDLIGKKDCAAKCPPSMFTGKARLYAQAQLGAPLKKWGWTLDLPIGQAPQWVHDSTGFVLDINVGVYIDDTNKHWLISVSGAGVMVTPLKPSKSAKLLRQKLSDPADMTKIEAYILAHSIPGGASESFFVEVSGLPPPYMLGYGWKFNWDGDKADIIQHIEGFPTHTSTHYRLSINRQTSVVSNIESNRWTATISTVSGPHIWHNSKYAQVIAGPDWLTNTLLVFGTKYGTNVGLAPVYCFYKHNELELIDYSVSGGENVVKYSRTASPTYFASQCDWTVDNWVGMNTTVYDTFGTFGAEGGTAEWRLRTHNPVTVGFSSTQAACVSSDQSYIYEVRTTGSKSFTGGNGGWDSYSGTPDWLDQAFNNPSHGVVRTLSDGVPLYLGGAVIHYEKIAGVPAGYIHTYFTEDVNFSCEYESGAHTESSRLLLLVPFHDAEAAYLWGNKNTYRAAEGWSGTHYGSTTYWARRYGVWNTYDGGYTYVQEYDGLVYGAGSGSFVYPSGAVYYGTEEKQNDDETISSVLLTSNSGPVQFSPPVSLSAFFSGEDYVEQQFYTHSAAVGAAVYGYGASNLEGFPVTFTLTSPPPFIGWA